ncbi:hypothetical protein [Cohnella terricola]|uniref:Uncharacterized protein n=1 Tax=Cohnella terricola TaxID=1289167 RepID=A0A559JNI4_9BACL|nr:hypothetical protein [Cohnella terricola]TVY01441.1 hypothetical protein FPZ45_09920 [Cohnella terricola]
MSDTFQGSNGKFIVDPLKITIKYIGEDDEEIYLKNITSIELQKPAFLQLGYIKFNHPSSDKSVIKVAGNDQYQNMVKAKQLIEQYLSPGYHQAPPAPPSTTALLAAEFKANNGALIVEPDKITLKFK